MMKDADDIKGYLKKIRKEIRLRKVEKERIEKEIEGIDIEVERRRKIREEKGFDFYLWKTEGLEGIKINLKRELNAASYNLCNSLAAEATWARSLKINSTDGSE